MKHHVLCPARVLLRLSSLHRHSGTRRRRGPGIHSHSRGLWIPGFLAALGTRNDGGAIGVGRSRSALAAFVAALLLPAAAVAQDYPNRPITLIVPYSAGGGNDLMARTAAEKMSKTLGQQIVIENRGGAGGSIATRQIAKSTPDGYTLGLGGTGTLAINPTLYGNVGYDPRKDFAPIGLIATSALVVCVNPSLPVRTIPELIALAKKTPGHADLCLGRDRQRHPSRQRILSPPSPASS